MAVLADRQLGYKRGLVVLVLGTVVFVVGFATPHWSRYKFILEGITIEGNSGLWEACVDTLGQSICFTTSSTNDWFMAIKALECIAVVGLALAACYAVGVNFLVAKPRFSRLLEICTACAGTSGVVGAVVYLSWINQDTTAFLKLHKDNKIDHHTFHWSFGLNIAGAVLVLIASFLIAHYNKPLPHNQAAADTSVASTTVAAPGNTPHHGGAAHAPYPGSNPYAVSVGLQQSGELHPPVPPAYYEAGVTAQWPMHGHGQAPSPVVEYNSDGLQGKL